MTTQLAHHEAGHAVSMVVLGIPVLRATLGELVHGAAGGVLPVPGGNPDGFLHAITCLAGPASGVRFVSLNYSESERAGWELEEEIGSYDDRSKAESWAGSRYDEASERATNIVSEHWAAIVRLAELLESAREIDGETVHRIVKEST